MQVSLKAKKLASFFISKLAKIMKIFKKSIKFCKFLLLCSIFLGDSTYCKFLLLYTYILCLKKIKKLIEKSDGSFCIEIDK